MATAVGMLMVTACGDGDGTAGTVIVPGFSPSAEGPVEPDPSSQAPATPDDVQTTAAAPDEVQTRDYAFTYSEPSGVTVHGLLRLSKPLPGDDPALADTWSAIVDGAPESPDCLETPSRDAAVVGSLEFESESPDYAPTDLDLTFEFDMDSTQTTNRMAVYYSSGGGCSYSGSTEVAPDMHGERWGPVPVAFVVTNAFGPSGFDNSIYSQVSEVSMRLSNSAVTLLPGPGMRADEYNSYSVGFDLPLG